MTYEHNYVYEYIDILELIKKLVVHVEGQKAQCPEHTTEMVGRDYAWLVPAIVDSCVHKEVRLLP